jgi:hypothetical protein
MVCFVVLLIDRFVSECFQVTSGPTVRYLSMYTEHTVKKVNYFMCMNMNIKWKAHTIPRVTNFGRLNSVKTVVFTIVSHTTHPYTKNAANQFKLKDDVILAKRQLWRKQVRWWYPSLSVCYGTSTGYNSEHNSGNDLGKTNLVRRTMASPHNSRSPVLHLFSTLSYY